jgi:NADPH:quinone reductase
MGSRIATKVLGIRVEKSGDADVLEYKSFDLPAPAAGEVRVQIHAAGVNFIDIYQRTGRYATPLPYTPGREAAGIVEEVGPGVSTFKTGDRVMYTSGLGGYAQAANVSADALIPIPDKLSFVEGAALPLQGMTAHYLIHEFHQIKPGETVLIHAAAGGMGLLLTQWVKHCGARVIGTVSSAEKAKIATEAGADEIINYTEQDFVAEVKRLTDNVGADYIIDGVGKTTFPGDMEAVKLLGDIALYGSASGPADPIGPNSLQVKSISLHGGSLFNFIIKRDQLLKRANAVLKAIDEGWLKLRVDHVLPLEQASEAHKLLEGRQTIGKVILQAR